MGLAAVRGLDRVSVSFPPQSGIVGALSEEVRGRIRSRQIGYVFQASRLFRLLSALENVSLALDVSGQRDRYAPETAEQALVKSGLPDKWRLRPNEFSGGKGKVFAMLVGALIIGVLRNGLTLLNISSFGQQIIIGMVIIVAVLLDMALKKSRR